MTRSLSLLLLLAISLPAAAGDKAPFQKNDRVVFIGDTFAERAGLYGYIETLIHARFPELKLSFRNMGYSADTVGVHVADIQKGTTEDNRGSNRALNFGPMPQHLKEAKADVIVMCFGMADSFAGKAGLDDFKTNLEFLLKHHSTQIYNGKTPPRFILIGPIAHEKMGGQFPDPAEHNESLKLYSDAMKKVAAERKLPFVELFGPMKGVMDEFAAQKPDLGVPRKLTINGIHLHQGGYYAAAHLILEGLGFPLPQWKIEVDGDGGAAKVTGRFLPPPPIDWRGLPNSLKERLSIPLVWKGGPKKGDFNIAIDEQFCTSSLADDLARGLWLLQSPMQNETEKLRLAVVEQNQQWFYKWRAVNGEYIYGRRAKPFGVVNFPGEMIEMDKIVAKLDREIHTLSKPRDKPFDVRILDAAIKLKFAPLAKVKRETVPPPITDLYKQKPGIINGKEFLTAKDPEAARKAFKLQEGYEVNLFASEQDFPLHNPLAMAWDARGRLWVSTMPSYPQYLPGNPPNDQILILEDTNGDGKADKCTVFADGLYLPTGFEFGDGGVYVASQPNLLFLKDLDGDDKADTREVILHGFGTGDSHHAMHAFVWTPEGALLFHEGIFHRTNCETPWGVVRQRDAGIYRFQPKSHKLETYVSYNFANPWGQVFDKYGQNFIADASGGANYFGLPLTGHVPFPRQHQDMKVFTSVVRPTCGCELVASRHFPPEAQGNFLVNNCIGFQGTKQHQVIEEGSGFTSKELTPLIFSADRNYRPVAIKHGPDGAMYIVDWYNPLIGHMQHSIRDPDRDHYHGRVWRITYKGRDLVKMPKIHGASVKELLECLKEPESLTRYLARNELRERRAEAEVEIGWWLKGLKEDNPDHERLLLEAYWVRGPVTDDELRPRLLVAKDSKVRAAGTRQLRYAKLLPELWTPKEIFQELAEGGDSFVLSDLPAELKKARYVAYLSTFVKERNLKDGRIRLADFLEFVEEYHPKALRLEEWRDQVNDVHPRVRLEAIVGLSFFKDAKAAEIALLALKHPRDYYIDYALKETMTTLEPYWKAAVAAGKPFAADNPAGAAYILGSVKTEDLAKMPKTAPVLIALLTRDGVLPSLRQDALESLAKLNKTEPMEQLLTMIGEIDSGHGAHAAVDHSGHALHDLGLLLSQRKEAELKKVRPRLEKLALSAKQSTTRQTALVALMTADQSLEPAWAASSKAIDPLKDFLEAVPLLPDAKLRGEAYKRVRPLLDGPPPKLAGDKVSAVGRFVRIELPGADRVLTLAEVEIFSGGRNIALGGKAKQSSVDFGGDPRRAVDGNKSGTWADGGQTHTKTQKNPWWEIDLGKEVEIDAVIVWNRNEDGGKFAKRLDGFSLLILSPERKTVASRTGIAAPAENTRIELSRDPAREIRVAAIHALSAMPGFETEVFSSLASDYRNGKDRDDIVRAIRRIPRGKWDKDALAPLAKSIISYLLKLDPKDRTEPAALDTLALGNDLITLLPAATAKELKAQIDEIGVTVAVVRAIPHRIEFDRKKIYVEAGKPSVIIFENTDIMPHNLLVCQPGSLAEVGLAAEAMASDPDAFARHFVPKNKKVLHATRLLQPREVDRLQFIAPEKPGEYVFVCTFPGHWRVMNGVLHVVPKLADVPASELHPPTDFAAETRKFVRNWTVAELTPDLIHLEKNRDFVRGKEMFKAATCIQCHKVGGEGGDIGPDLSLTAKKMAEVKMSKLNLLTEILEPSATIDEKYRPWTFSLSSGAFVSGLIQHEDKKTLRVIAGPNEKPREIRVADVEEKTPSKVSIMPTGLVVTLTKDELLDLMAYVLANGDREHRVFQRKE